MATNRRQKENGRAAFEKREKRRKIRALQDEIEKHDAESVKDMLNDEFDVDFQYRGQTALQLAVREGCYDICKLLIQKGADVNKCDAEMNNLLNMACWRGYSNIAQLLIHNNADLNARNDFGSTSLNTSVYKGHGDICQKLVDADCDPDIPNTRGYSPLHTAARHDRVDIVNLLIEAKCDVNNLDEDRRTPLNIAADLGHSGTVTALLAAGADSNIQDKYGKFALYDAASKGSFEVVKHLLKNEKTDLNLFTSKGVTALLESIRQNSMEIAGLLLECGCDPNLCDRTKQSPIHAAVRQVSQFFGSETYSATELVKKLIEAGCDINAVDAQGWCPVFQSAFAGDVELTKLFIENGAKLTSVTATQDSVLHGGVSANQPEIVDLLISAGSSVNTVNMYGENPLYTAVKTRANIKIIESLIKAGSHLNVQENQHRNAPIHEALVQHHTEAALSLLEAGCDVNVRNSKLQDPLYVACEKGNDVVLSWMISSPKCSLKGENSYPVALHAAISFGQAKIAVMLIEAGCDINQFNEHGLTPIQTAAREDNFSMAKLLLQYGSNLGANREVAGLLPCCITHDDPHPHFELEPLFFAMKHRNIELLKLFINCYFFLPYSLVRVIGTILQSAPELYAHYPRPMRKEILTVFAEAICVPQKLQNICRSVVLHSLDSCPHKKVPVLPVASKVKDFLLRKDIFDPLKEEDTRDPGKFHRADSEQSADN